MADRMRHVRPGDPLDISAAVYNEILDALLWIRGQRSADQTDSTSQPFRPGMVRVRNDTDTDCNPGDILGVADVVEPPTNMIQGQRILILKGVIPAAPSHNGRFVVCADAIEKTKIGRAYLYGVCPVQITMNAPNDPYAEIADGSTAALSSGSSGTARILYAPDGTGWGVVRLGGGGGSESKGTQQGQIHQMITDATAAWSFAMLGP